MDIQKQDEQRSIITDLATTYGMDRKSFWNTVKRTIDPQNKATAEDMGVFLLMAKEHGLNPLTGEIWLLMTRNGARATVSIDGWMKLCNEHPQFDGIEFIDNWDDKRKLVSITCKIYRKDRGIPTSVTEYLAECYRDTVPWQKFPARMLRHKATAQAARYAFGFAGIVDPDEAERYVEAGVGYMQEPKVTLAPVVDSTPVVKQEPQQAPEPKSESKPEPVKQEQPQAKIVEENTDLEDMSVQELRALAVKYGMSEEDASNKRRSTLVPFLESYMNTDSIEVAEDNEAEEEPEETVEAEVVEQEEEQVEEPVEEKQTIQNPLDILDSFNV